MVKGIVIGIAQSEDMSGYGAAMIVLSEENLKTLNRVREVFKQVHTIDSGINHIEYVLNPLKVELLNDDFEPNEDDIPEIYDLTDEEYGQYSKIEKYTSQVENSALLVGHNGIRVTWQSKYVSGEEVWLDVEFDAIDNLIQSL